LRKTIFARGFVAAASIFGMSRMPGFRSEGTMGDVADDSTISTEVKATLFGNEILSGFAISV
jgi:osmotically-inducible protein OsmY